MKVDGLQPAVEDRPFFWVVEYHRTPPESWPDRIEEVEDLALEKHPADIAATKPAHDVAMALPVAGPPN